MTLTLDEMIASLRAAGLSVDEERARDLAREEREVPGACSGCRDGDDPRRHFACSRQPAASMVAAGWRISSETLEQVGWRAWMVRDGLPDVDAVCSSVPENERAGARRVLGLPVASGALA